MNIQSKAYAKLNLTLDITGVKDGFHLLNSVVCSVDLYDLISVSSRKDKAVTVTMRGLGSEAIPLEKNNAYIAATAFVEKFNTCGADITVYKNIPMGAGLGGSSADAAGVLNALKKLYKIDDEVGVKQIADAIGSDVGYMLYGGYALLSGRGEIITPIASDLRLDILLFVPQYGVSTAQCFKLYDQGEKPVGVYSQNAKNALCLGDKALLCKNLNNHLFAPACALCDGVEREYKNALSFAPLGVNMTGSGSAVYAVFESAEMCRYVASRYRGKAKIIQTKTVL
ncbi:MAG: 4-(cytidine 5'-diphospho)-2-C-methyl-D-erythritol kinase [Clostridiales bacterium]|nr:4-(cytidine 5'-diphospho)-2-C-methyl-D-erythritol kinase [Clostridiales bacterium]